MAKPDNDASVLARIEALVADEHGLFDRGELSADEQKRLADVQVQLDRCWDLLRQRRALREVRLGSVAGARARCGRRQEVHRMNAPISATMCTRSGEPRLLAETASQLL
jgi:uncharacterized protein DUF2630